MQFWGVELKSGESCEVNLRRHYVLHMTQAALGPVEDETEQPVIVKATYCGHTAVFAVLHYMSHPHEALEKVFEGKVQITHNRTNGSVYLVGYLDFVPGSKNGYSFLKDIERDAEMDVDKEKVEEEKRPYDVSFDN